MKHLRRSTKGSTDTVSTVAQHTSIPTKDPSSIIPPKKVIRALYDYTPNPPNPQYLPFSQGDFLHVIDRENDSDWFVASNPLQGTRGFVPANYFQVVGRNARESSGHTTPPVRSPQPQGHDSGYAEKAVSNGNALNQSNGQMNGASFSNGPSAIPQHMLSEGDPRMSKTMGRAGNMVYGSVQYDFNAERPDELEAKAGEFIIVIAISNPEWFVAKPIQRLGGPGLIPVSFIEIRDMATGKAVDDPHEAVRRAGVPKVEEWKKMAAEYKNSSIPLGQLSQTQSMVQSMDRLSVSNGARASQAPDQSQNYGDTRSYQQGHSRAGSFSQPGGPYGQNQYRSSYHSQPVWARVPRFCHQRDEYWYIIETALQDGRHWDLSRNYKDFYGLQLALKDSFPWTAEEKPGQHRILPYMPGPLPWVTDHITRERRAHLDKYIKEVLANNLFASSNAVKQFFAPREGDNETGPKDAESPDDADWVRLSHASSAQSAHQDSRQSSSSNLAPINTNTSYNGSPQNMVPPQQRYQGYPPTNGHGYGASKPAPAPHQRSPSEMRTNLPPPAPMLRQNTNMSNYSNGSAQSAVGPSAAAAAAAGGAPVKIKVFFGEQNVVVIRLPAGFSFRDLLVKLRERWSMEPGVDRSSAQDTDFVIQWKDDMTGQFSKLQSQEELDYARSRTEKLTLRVSAII